MKVSKGEGKSDHVAAALRSLTGLAFLRKGTMIAPQPDILDCDWLTYESFQASLVLSSVGARSCCPGDTADDELTQSGSLYTFGVFTVQYCCSCRAKATFCSHILPQSTRKREGLRRHVDFVPCDEVQLIHRLLDF